MSRFSSNINSFFNSVCYRIEEFLIDPGDEWDAFNNVESVLLTHAHFDHIYGINEVLNYNPIASIYTNDFGLTMLLDDKKNMSRYHDTPFKLMDIENICVVQDREKIRLANGIVAEAVFTPGHNPSCITWIIDNKIFTGDSFIPGVKTITNLPGGNSEQAQQSEILIIELMEARSLKIFPGHKI